ncbi:peptide/nickel transport system permease protein [Catenulispora sp. GP43]|uniref:ABC transporter permease n=1 Tax=Catenulispora sp. GP43 TaxID=3156263 RepID=UPI003519A521
MSQPVVVSAQAAAATGRAKFRFRMPSVKVSIGLGMLLVFTFVALFGASLAPFDPSKRSNDILQSPSAKHLFGTTHLGQDIFSQILVGTRSVMFVGFFAGILATAIAVLVGVTSGYLSGFWGDSVSTLSNVFIVIPALPLIVIVTNVIPNSGDWAIALVIGCTSWAWGARLLRAQTLSLRNRDFVQAAKANGESTWRIVVAEILPNLTAIIASSFIGTVMFAVMTEIALAYVGVSGISEWNWGEVLFWAQGQQALAIGAWWWFVPAGLCIALLGTALALVNFGIDEIVNPRLRGGAKTVVRTADGRKARMRIGFTPVLSPRTDSGEGGGGR